MPIKNWSGAMNQFAILFEGRVPKSEMRGALELSGCVTLLLGNPETPVTAETLFCIVDPLRPAGHTGEVRLRLKRPAIQVSATFRLPDLLEDTESSVLVV